MDRRLLHQRPVLVGDPVDAAVAVVSDHGFATKERDGGLEFERLGDQFIRLNPQECLGCGLVADAALAQALTARTGVAVAIEHGRVELL